MILLQSSLPCSENFYRYKKNYERFVNQGAKSNEGSPKSISDAEKAGVKRKMIASPKIMSKLSPINTLVARQSLNVNPNSQKALLRFAVNNKESQDISAHSQDGGEEENKTNSIPICNFKSNKLSHIDKKHRAEEA